MQDVGIDVKIPSGSPLYPWLKREPELQSQMIKRLTEHLNKELLEQDLTPWLDEPARKGERTFILQILPSKNHTV